MRGRDYEELREGEGLWEGRSYRRGGTMGGAMGGGGTRGGATGGEGLWEELWEGRSYVEEENAYKSQ